MWVLGENVHKNKRTGFLRVKTVVDPALPQPVAGTFGANVCENERIGSCRGACTGH